VINSRVFCAIRISVLLLFLSRIGTELERPRSRPHWLLYTYSFQFRNAFRASASPSPTLVTVTVTVTDTRPTVTGQPVSITGQIATRCTSVTHSLADTSELNSIDAYLRLVSDYTAHYTAYMTSKIVFMKHILRLVNYCKNTITSTQPTFLSWRFGLYQRPSSEKLSSFLFRFLSR